VPSTLDQLIAQAAGAGVAAFDAKVLAAHALGASRAWLAAHGADALSATQTAAVQQALARRAAGEPVAYITGQREFYGLAFAVTPAVLIPRPETEWLVDFIVQHAPLGGSVADIGCGSGAIAVAAAHARPDLHITATDLSADALAVAQRNAHTHGVAARMRFAHGDVYTPLAGQRFDVIVSNPPYVAASDAHLTQGDLRFEPRSALTDAADGLSILRRLAQGAPAHLKPHGWLALEHGYNQADAVQALLRAAGLENVRTTADLAGQPRNTAGQRA
jgi:release factor glutamine methyltransferase